jgi:hypothetical protein
LIVLLLLLLLRRLLRRLLRVLGGWLRHACSYFLSRDDPFGGADV